MECPFELPVRIKDVGTLAKGDKVQDIVDDKGNSLTYANENLPYIVQAINSHEKLEERYKDQERLWELADQDNCDGDCDLEPPHKRCAECLARSALNDLGEMRGQLIDEIEQALTEAEKN